MLVTQPRHVRRNGTPLHRARFLLGTSPMRLAEATRHGILFAVFLAAFGAPSVLVAEPIRKCRRAAAFRRAGFQVVIPADLVIVLSREGYCRIALETYIHLANSQLCTCSWRAPSNV